VTSDERGADREKQRRGQIGDAKRVTGNQAQRMRLLGKFCDIKSKEYSTILLVLIYYWNARRPCCVAHRPWAAQCAQTRSDKANDKGADSLDLTNECKLPESQWVVRRNCPK